MRVLGKGKKTKRVERDSLSGGRNSDTRSGWLGAEATRWYILVALSAVISIFLFPNILTKPKVYGLGDVAERDIKASQEFLVENKDLTEMSRQEALKTVLSVYDFDPSGGNAGGRVQEAFALGRAFCKERPTPAEGAPSQEPDKPQDTARRTEESVEGRFFELLDMTPDHAVFVALMDSGFPSEVEKTTADLLARVFTQGVVGDDKMLRSQSGKGITLHDMLTKTQTTVTDLSRFHDLTTSRPFVKEQAGRLGSALESKESLEIAGTLATALIRPNVTFNKRETLMRQDLARQSVKPFYFKIKKGEMLVREGERITPEHLMKLTEQYRNLKAKEMLVRAPAMAILIGLLLSVMYLVGLLGDRSERARVKDLLFNAMTILVLFLVVVATSLVADEISRGFPFFTPSTLLFAIPVACGAMLVSIFQGMNAATSFSLIVSVFASLVVGGRVEFFLYFFISSLVAGYGVTNCRERGVLIRAALKVGAANIIMALSIQALAGSLTTVATLIAVASAFVGGLLAGVIATGLLPLVEMSFGYTTDIKLLELANLDQVLLRELMVQAPGTYHHSVIVSNMVEATAKAVNANPLLAKVAAYYHDIGKVTKPLYFIENQSDCGNRHEKLAPSMSSLILISHVKDGVELAKKHKVGRELIDIIRQHHGTSLISFFYEKAKEQGEKKGGKSVQAMEADFRYPGPKPQTKEAGLVMLADVVEAASRTLVDPTGARIQGMVQKIINRVFSDGQLDECELTLKDLHEIAKSFNKTLSGIFHHRIEYPEPVARAPLGKKGTNGNSDQPGQSDTWAKRSDDGKESGESLKRLGL